MRKKDGFKIKTFSSNLIFIKLVMNVNFRLIKALLNIILYL